MNRIKLISERRKIQAHIRERPCVPFPHPFPRPFLGASHPFTLHPCPHIIHGLGVAVEGSAGIRAVIRVRGGGATRPGMLSSSEAESSSTKPRRPKLLGRQHMPIKQGWDRPRFVARQRETVARPASRQTAGQALEPTVTRLGANRCVTTRTRQRRDNKPTKTNGVLGGRSPPKNRLFTV